MSLFAKFKAGLRKTHSKLAHEIKRVVSRSPRLDAAGLENLEDALIGADLGMPMTAQIVAAVKKTYETQGGDGADVFAVARREVENSLSTRQVPLIRSPAGPTVVSIVGVNGTGKTTAAAKLAHLVKSRGQTVLLAACDTFRAAAIEQLKLWGQRLNVEVIAGLMALTRHLWPTMPSPPRKPVTSTICLLILPAACTPNTISCRNC